MTSATAQIYHFGKFRLDPATRELWCEDEEQELPPKAFSCLIYLIEHRERVVGRGELIDAVWGRKHLAESVLGRAIFLIRRALGDDGDEPRHIKTARGVGYRWIAPVEVEEKRSGATSPDGRRWPMKRLSLAPLLIGILLFGVFYLWRGDRAEDIDGTVWHRNEGNIALLLPVTVDGDDHHQWIRFGAMELIAQRLRMAGQPMVPSETVIALTRDVSTKPEPDDLKRLTATTGASLVFAGHVESTDAAWRVSLQGLHENTSPSAVYAESEDLLEAVRAAADQLALSLDLVPVPELGTEPDLAILLRRVESARLAQQHDVAREIIEAADPGLREHPEVKFQLIRLDYYSERREAARAGLEELLADSAVRRDSLLEARILNGLAAIYLWDNDLDSAESYLNRAARLLDDQDGGGLLGTIHNNLSLVARRRNEHDLTSFHTAQARSIFEGIGDVWRLARLDADAGSFEISRERYADALRFLDPAAERHTAVQDVGGELRARVLISAAHRELLDFHQAAATEARVSELLEQTTNPVLIAFAKLHQAALYDVTGRDRAADRLLDDVINNAGTPQVSARHPVVVAAYLLRAERAIAYEADITQAADIAKRVIEALAGDADRYDQRTHAGLILVRAHIAQGQYAAAAEVVAAMNDWAQLSGPQLPKILSALGEAELAAAVGRVDASGSAFEKAFALADSGGVPSHLLRVVRSYVPWLLEKANRESSEPRVLLIAERISAYADQAYEAALLQVRVYHAMGNQPAWRTSLDRTIALAGERKVPQELLVPP